MFSGGGIAWADAAMKRGEIAVPPAPPGAHPDLSALLRAVRNALAAELMR